MHAKKFAEAQVKFQQALSENPNFAEAHNNLGPARRTPTLTPIVDRFLAEESNCAKTTRHVSAKNCLAFLSFGRDAYPPFFPCSASSKETGKNRGLRG
jgi:hypothetical protein